MAKRVPDVPADKPPKRRAPRQLPDAEPASDDLQAIFGQNLKIARLKRGMTLIELADAVDMHFSSVSQIEHGATNITLRTMKRLAAVMDLDVRAMLQPNCAEPEPPSKKAP